jgi:putative CRISPR-associated protein (TIGR02620 family)
MEEVKMTVVVTRHPALLQLLKERGLINGEATVLTHVADPTILDGQHVIGSLPLHLAARCASVTEVPLDLNPQDRGLELGIERLREIAGDPVTYVIHNVTDTWRN